MKVLPCCALHWFRQGTAKVQQQVLTFVVVWYMWVAFFHHE
jgi:hypothetical protein